MRVAAEHLIGLVIGGIVLCFCLSLLWGGSSGHLIGQSAQSLMEVGESPDAFSGHGEQIRQLISREPPELRAGQATVRVGEAIDLWDQIQVQTPEGGWIALSQQSGVTGQLLAFYDGRGQRFLPIPWKQGEEPDEIIAPMGFDLAEGKLIFFTGGSYRVAVRLRDSYGRKTEMKVAFLAEVQ